MTDLSPAARAVLARVMEFSGPAFESLVRKMLAAALQAAANELGYRIIYDDKSIDYRVEVHELLALANELEGK